MIDYYILQRYASEYNACSLIVNYNTSKANIKQINLSLDVVLINEPTNKVINMSLKITQDVKNAPNAK